jgi:L-iditol 2-dehydrogenase
MRNLCEDLLFNNGAYAEYIRIPRPHCRAQHVRNPRARQLSGRRLDRTAGLRFFGGCPNDSRISLDTNLLHYSEITCKASFHHTPPTSARRWIGQPRRDHGRDFVNSEEPLANLLEVMRHLMSHNGH